MTSFVRHPGGSDAPLTPEECETYDRLRRSLPGRETNDAFLDRYYPRPDDLDYADLPHAFQQTVHHRGRLVEFLSGPQDLPAGESVPDYWFEAARRGRVGVTMAAQHLRPVFPLLANAIAEFTTDIRVARFSFSADDPRTRIGLFYLQRSKKEGRPLALVGFPPNPSPATPPPYWSLVPPQLREFTATVHDGLVEDHRFDNGLVAVSALRTCEEYASQTGVFDEVEHITAYDAGFRPVPMDEVARPPAMCVVAHNGRRVAYMFEITDPRSAAWSFGDDTLLQATKPITELLDDVMATRIRKSSRLPDADPNPAQD